MKIKKHNLWNLNYREAVELQKRLSAKVVRDDRFANVKKIAGVDVRYIKESNKFLCGVIIFSYPSLEVLEEKYVYGRPDYPYIPGLLSFREGPVVEKCFKKLKEAPDLAFFDGHGYAHPRRFGLASHMGVLLNLTSIGCAKSILCGNYNGLSLGKKKGSYSYIEDNDKIIGAAVRTRDNTKPVFVSVGNKICLDSVIKFTLAVSEYRIPEPTRIAHNRLKSVEVS